MDEEQVIGETSEPLMPEDAMVQEEEIQSLTESEETQAEQPTEGETKTDIDPDIQAKLQRLEQLEKDAEIQNILQQRALAARMAEEQERAIQERQALIDQHFARQRSILVNMLNSDKISSEDFIAAMDELTQQRVELANRQLAQEMDQRIQQAIEARLAGIGEDYRLRQSFRKWAPDVVQVDPRVEEAVSELIKMGATPEMIGLIVSAAKKAGGGQTQTSKQSQRSFERKLAAVNSIEAPNAFGHHNHIPDKKADIQFKKDLDELLSLEVF